MSSILLTKSIHQFQLIIRFNVYREALKTHHKMLCLRKSN